VGENALIFRPTQYKYLESVALSRKFTSVKSSAPIITAPASEEAVKKFGNAKSISSDQYFGNGQEMDYETRANLARFEGAKCLGSADLWGNGSAQPTSSYTDHVPEMSDIKDSIKTGASKVAEKLSSLSSYLSVSLLIALFVCG
jgi:ADP-ribosylation factor GTPase-activating protein 2/3